jgi:hypothetical protein
MNARNLKTLKLLGIASAITAGGVMLVNTVSPSEESLLKVHTKVHASSDVHCLEFLKGTQGRV